MNSDTVISRVLNIPIVHIQLSDRNYSDQIFRQKIGQRRLQFCLEM